MSLNALGRPLAMWFGSFCFAASVLILYCHVPLGPLILAGGLTLALTIVRALRSQRQERARREGKTA